MISNRKNENAHTKMYKMVKKKHTIQKPKKYPKCIPLEDAFWVT